MKPAIQAPAKAPSLQGARFSNGTAKEQNEPERHSEVLNSWTEIAVYLGRGVRTAQRWERELQLPVRRPRERSRSAVIAFRSELDRWLLAVDTNGGLQSQTKIRFRNSQSLSKDCFGCRLKSRQSKIKSTTSKSMFQRPQKQVRLRTERHKNRQ